MSDHDTLNDLREALGHSPDNVPLRHHLGRLLLRRGFVDEAEKLYRDGLEIAPASETLQLGLAHSCLDAGRVSEASVIVEALVESGRAAPETFLLQARLLIREGNLERAGHAYRRAIDGDASLADDDLEAMFGSPSAPAQERPRDEPERLLAGDMPFDTGDDPGTELEQSNITFSDVGGMEPVKDEIRMKIIHPLANPELFAQYGQAAGGGVLLYGPPGCGKTHLARATAGEVDSGFIAVGIHEVLDMYIGQSEQRLHAIFEQARTNKPCVLFFDEVDALGASRTDMRRTGGRHLINQFLSEMDGAQQDNDGILVLGATNAPWHLDAAFRRPGRFDRVIFVPPPDEAGRAAILRVLLRGRPVDSVDHDAVAKKAAGFSGADLMALVDMATQKRLAEAMQSGAVAPITTKDLKAAIRQVKPSTKEWFATAKNYAMYANESGAYDDVLKYLK